MIISRQCAMWGTKLKSEQTPTIEGKINARFLLLGVVAIFFTSALLILVFHRSFDKQVKKDVQLVCTQVSAAYPYLPTQNHLQQFASEDVRITLIAQNGAVLFESMGDISQMDNHLQRPEIADAIKSGQGHSRRSSGTMGIDTYYCATKLPDGNILRISCQVSNLFAAYYSAYPAVIILLCLVLFASVILAFFLTRQIVRPMSSMAGHLDDLPENVPYRELIPFAKEVQQQQKKRLENERIRQEFTANVSHELKTPLTSISGYAEMMEAGMVQPQDLSLFAGKIRTEAGRLIALIGDIIKLSQMDEPVDNSDFAQVNLGKIATDVADLLLLQGQKLGVTILVDPCAQDIFVLGIETELFELCYNLVDNALRYNRPGGKVEIGVLAGDCGITLRVHDTGIGIPPQHQSRIFERFYRVDKSRSKQTGGTGLGLAIVKHIAIHHDATITLVSMQNEGTQIDVTFKK